MFFLPTNSIEEPKIISKLPICELAEIESLFHESLERLNIPCLYGYLFHDYTTFRKNIEAIEFLKSFNKAGKICKIGFSLYYPSQIEELIQDKIPFDIVQIPYNIFDTRFQQSFKLLKKHNVEIHVRSVFLQGLFFKDSNELNNKLTKLKAPLIKLYNLAQKKNISIMEIALGFALLNNNIDKVIIGVDSLTQFEKNIQVFQRLDDVSKIMSELDELSINKEELVIPTHW